MTTSAPYTFDAMSRMGSDQCNLDINAVQNMDACNYTLQNYHLQDDCMAQPIQFALQQPGVNFTGGHNIGTNGCNVDDNSQLMIGSVQTQSRCRIDLFQRPFATVPFLGRGSACPVMEAQIQQGEQLTNRRSVNRLSERSYSKYSTTPLLQSVHERVTNPRYSVEGVADKSWIRGGVPSRELNKS